MEPILTALTKLHRDKAGGSDNVVYEMLLFAGVEVWAILRRAVEMRVNGEDGWVESWHHIIRLLYPQNERCYNDEPLETY